MRFAAQKTIGMQDMLPANGSIYMCNMDNKMTSMMDALKAWEKKRGLSFSFKGKFIENRPKKEVEEKAKEAPKVDRPITVPRTPGKPGRRSTLTKEERRKRKNESNKRARSKNREHHAAKSRDWRAKLTPEQKAEIQRKNRDWKRARKAERLAAANAGNGSSQTGMPLADSAISGKKGTA
jgi:hypothetical protein